jgi:putative iron-dependent peroxidase
MYTPQAGIFALGTSSHAYLEFDLLDAKKDAKKDGRNAKSSPRQSPLSVNREPPQEE